MNIPIGEFFDVSSDVSSYKFVAIRRDSFRTSASRSCPNICVDMSVLSRPSFRNGARTRIYSTRSYEEENRAEKVE